LKFASLGENQHGGLEEDFLKDTSLLSAGGAWFQFAFRVALIRLNRH
jgi:hypothetical protein